MINNTIKKIFTTSSESQKQKKHFPNSENITGSLSVRELIKNFTNTEIPNDPKSLEEYLKILQTQILPSTVNVSNPKFIGHMTSALPNFHQYIAQLLVTLNQNVVKIETSNSLTFLERQCVAILHKKFFQLDENFYTNYTQNPENVLGVITSNGSIANITALWAARNKGLESDELSCKKDGIKACLEHNDYNDMVVISSELAHYSLEKFASLTGLGTKNILRLKTVNGKMNLNELYETIKMCKINKKFIIAIIGVAGTTEIGSIDDLEKISTIAKQFDIHFHVDAAWGGPMIFSKSHRAKLKGIESADSITICGHKQLYLPQGISAILYKSSNLCKYVSTEARYQARKGSYDLGRWTFEGSRPAVSLFIHAGLHCIGESGYEFLIDRGIQLAQYFAKKIEKHNCFELLYQPQANIVSYRYKPRDLDNKIIDNINIELQNLLYKEGKSFVSRTTLPPDKYDTPIIALRAVFANPKTTFGNIDEILQEQINYAKQIASKEEMH